MLVTCVSTAGFLLASAWIFANSWRGTGSTAEVVDEVDEVKSPLKGKGEGDGSETSDKGAPAAMIGVGWVVADLVYWRIAYLVAALVLLYGIVGVFCKGGFAQAVLGDSMMDM